MPSGPRRLLLVTTEPPPTSSGLGTFWAKLAMGAVEPDLLTMDFLGPEPALASNHGESGLPAPSRLHGLGRPPFSRVSSLGRSTTSGWRRLAWSALRAPSALYERRARRNLYDDWIRERVAVRLPEVLDAHAFDLVLVKAPPLLLAETAFRIASSRRVPFGFFLGEPVDHRNDRGGVDPRGRGLQQELVDGAAAFVTTPEAYERYHRHALSIDPRRVVFLRDSFVPVGELDERETWSPVAPRSLLHWGQIQPWRPIEALLPALVRWNDVRGGRGCRSGYGPRLGLTVMGRVVDPRTRRLLRRTLGPLFETRAPLPYLDARAVARTARRFLVVTSPRHRDNIPSKLIDALAYRRPVLLLAHPDSASAEAVTRLGVGAVGDVRDGSSVFRALCELEEEGGRYEAAFGEAAVAEAFHFRSIGRRFRTQLFGAMGW